jgi:hypothetical protein
LLLLRRGLTQDGTFVRLTLGVPSPSPFPRREYPVAVAQATAYSSSTKRQRRWGIGVIRGHREQFGPLIEDYNGIVFVKHVKLPPILLS